MFNIGDLVSLHPDYEHYNLDIKYAPFTVISKPYINIALITRVQVRSPHFKGKLAFRIEHLIPYHPYGTSKPIKGYP